MLSLFKMLSNPEYFSPSLLISLVIIYGRLHGSEAIINGTNALPGEFPSIVSLRNETGGHYCGGTLVTRKHIITAAHCLYDDETVFYDGLMMLNPEKIKVVVGTLSSRHGGDVYEIEKFVKHPRYNISSSDQDLTRDVAVIVLKDEVDTENVVITPLSFDVPRVDSFANASGWGLLSWNANLSVEEYSDYPTDLQKLVVKIQDKTICRDKYQALPFVLPQIDTEYLICTEAVKDNAGMCIRDSGSPLMINGEYVGYNVGGYPCVEGYPDFFGSTAAHQEFIKSVINS